MGQINIGTPIDTSLIKCCFCHKGYEIKGNLYENNILVCPHCKLTHKIDFTLFDKKIENLKKIDKLNLTAIDIGTSEVINRPNAYPPNWTFILVENPANETGEINEIKVWVDENCTNFTVATFDLISGTTFTARDSEVIGNVTKGALRTFSVTLNVEVGDYLGYYCNSAGNTVECTLSGDGVWEKAGDQTGCVGAVFATGANRTLSLYGTGATVAADFECVGTGSITFSGTALTVVGLAYVGSGSLAYSGEAVITYTRDFLSTAVGELIYSGAALFSYLCNFLFSGSGELAYSGNAIITIGFAYIGNGILTYSGEAVQLFTFNFIYEGSGSLVYSGSAECIYEIVGTEYEYVGSGSYAFSGTAIQVYTTDFLFVASGQLTYSGSAVCRYVILWSMVTKETTDWGKVDKDYMGFLVNGFLVNGFLVDMWEKISKSISNFNKVSKEISDWSKVDKTKGEWDKVEKRKYV